MRSTIRSAAAARSLALLSLLSTSTVHAIPSPDTRFLEPTLDKRAVSYSACYSSSSGLSDQGTYVYQSSSYCATQCSSSGSSVLGLSGGDNCWCGNSLPPASSKVSDSQCSAPCTGFGSDKCGGNGFYSVYFTGSGQVVANPDSASSSSSSSPSAQTSSPPSTAQSTSQPTQQVTVPSQIQEPAPATTTAPTNSQATTTTAVVVTSIEPNHTIVITQSPDATATASPSPTNHSKGSSNTAGVAAGVVVGLVALAAIVGGLFFFLRNKRRQQAEREYRQRSQVSDFIAGGMERKNLGTSHSHRSDARLDPEAGRRNSVGSLADSNDYSRKILRVANPDSGH